MTTEEKAKAYDEALEHFKVFKEKYYTKDTNLGDVIFDKTGEMQKDFESIFPQLRESEDETTRKELLDFVRSFWADHKEKLPQASRWVIYLEKQKPDIELIQRSWYLEGYHDREFGKEPMWIIKTGEGGPKYLPNPKYGQKIEEQKPAWSEEDEKNMATLFEILNCYQRLYDGGVIVSAVNRREFLAGMTELSNWLKSLRPSWKPSEEQMKALEEARKLLHNKAIIYESNKILYQFESLIRDLYKL